jgi:hypothetical protein
VFLFVYNSSTGRFLVTFPCLYILYPKLVHPFYFSPFYLSPLLTVILTNLKILYSILYTKYITHIHLFNFLLLPSFSHWWPPLSTPCFFYVAYICIVFAFHTWQKTCAFSFWAWLTSLNMMSSNCTHLLSKHTVSFFLWLNKTPLCRYVTFS